MFGLFKSDLKLIGDAFHEKYQALYKLFIKLPKGTTREQLIKKLEANGFILNSLALPRIQIEIIRRMDSKPWILYFGNVSTESNKNPSDYSEMIFSIGGAHEYDELYLSYNSKDKKKRMYLLKDIFEETQEGPKARELFNYIKTLGEYEPFA
jgi:hypothetical protein